jgi:TrmH RNA methyltransferase
VKARHDHGPRAAAERVYGLAAARAAFAVRPDAVLSIAFTEALRKPLADMLRNAARRRIAYREVDAEELGHMAQSVHHEGVCLLVRPARSPDAAAVLAGLGERGLILALDGVQNPHNIGAVLRSAAYFGVSAVLYPDAAEGAASSLPAAARRVAEGGAEYVSVLRVPSLVSALAAARREGIVVIGSDARADMPLGEYAWPARALLVLGHERHGLSREVRNACQATLGIPGSQNIDSLNVSVAAGIFLASYARTHGILP